MKNIKLNKKLIKNAKKRKNSKIFNIFAVFLFLNIFFNSYSNIFFLIKMWKNAFYFNFY